MKSYPVYIAAAALVTTVATASWQQARAADELTVSVTVTNPCAIGTGSIAFGTISSDSSPAPASGTVTLTNCNGFDTTVTIGDSDNGGSAEFALKADNGDDLITYTMIEDTFFAGGSVAPGSRINYICHIRIIGSCIYSKS